MKKDTLIIIGNGFDTWQGLETSYAKFKDYYTSHRLELIKKLHIKPIRYFDEDGKEHIVTDAELIYGNPLDISELGDFFWSSFETSLSYVDSERINVFFGKDRRGLKRMRKSIKNARRILQKAFCDWIGSIDIQEKSSEYNFGDNCLFISFNYTDTLMKRFGVDVDDVFFIHGEKDDPQSIIFGHSSHPQLPEEFLSRLSGRFKGLYMIEDLLYETDKHVRDNMVFLAFFLASKEVFPEDIKNIYVLGHSMSLVDLEYFAFLANDTRVIPDKELSSADESRIPRYDSDDVDELHKRLQYTINHIGYGRDESEIDEEFIDAVDARFDYEQSIRDDLIQRELFRKLRKKTKKEMLSESMSDINKLSDMTSRKEDAHWVISYYGEESKVWYETLMEDLGCKSYELLPSIDDCLKTNPHVCTKMQH